jgi:serine/threonine protein kinase
MDPIVGKTIDTYKILDVLGRGGMGVVYKAVDTQLDREVAIKMMDVMIATDPNFMKRFQSEAKALAKLQNPNIVSVFALRQTDFGICIVMEFVRGKTLADLLKETRSVPIPRAIHIFKQLLSALDHAHRAGVIHRDIKPGNVMLAEGDVVKVTDFGLAKIQKGNASTMTMGTAGTLYYMSPEQIRGLSNVDNRGDIYSAGMALYETLTGRVPFKADDSDFVVGQMIVEGRIPPPDKMNPALPKDLVKVVMKSIDKDPARRYQSAAEMIVALSTFERAMRPGQVPLDSAPTIVGPISHPEPGDRPATPQRKRLILYGASAAALCVVAAAVWFFSPSEEGTLTVKLTPPGGKVYIDNALMEKSTLENHPCAPGAHRVTVLWGQGRLDTNVSITAGHASILLLAQRRQGEGVKTPVEEPAASSPLVDKGTTATVPETETHEVSMGTLLLEAIPAGEARVDDGSFRSAGGGTRHQVQVGMRRVTFRGGSGVTKEKSVHVAAGTTQTVRCYFTGTVNVVAINPAGVSTFASIMVDGVRQDKSTPTTLTLAAGHHLLSVSRQGFKVPDGERKVTVDPSFDGPSQYKVSFKLQRE